MFLIYNTVTFSVVQRRAVLGTLRALGVDAGQVFALVLVETAAAAAVGDAPRPRPGLAARPGRGPARDPHDQRPLLPARGDATRLSPRVRSAKGTLLGIGAGILAAVPAALEASRVEPVAALRPSTLASRSRSLLPAVAGAGVVIAGAGRGRSSSSSPARSERASPACSRSFSASPCSSPWLTVAAMALLGRGPRPSWRHAGTVATRTVARSVGRTGVAVAALMVAVSVTIGVSLMIQGFRATVENWLDLTPAGGRVHRRPASREAPGRPFARPGRRPARGRGAGGGRGGDVPRRARGQPVRGSAARRGRRPTRAPRGPLPVRRGQPRRDLEARDGGRGDRERALRLPPRAARARRRGHPADGSRAARRSPWPASSTTTPPSGPRAHEPRTSTSGTGTTAGSRPSASTWREGRVRRRGRRRPAARARGNGPAGDPNRALRAHALAGLRPHVRGDPGAAAARGGRWPSSASAARSWPCRWSGRASSRHSLALGLTAGQLWG